MSSPISQKDVTHIAHLAQLPLSELESAQFTQAFKETLAVVENLNTVPMTALEPTHQVTGLENIVREDQVDEKRMFSQSEAVANAARSYKGYFVVSRILDND